MDRDTVIAAIVETFKAVGRDDGYTLHEAQLTDQSMRREIPSKEFADAKRLDPHQDWQDIPGTALDECDAALSHLSPKGWRFYIPAYMIRAIELLNEPVSKTFLPGSVIFHLTLPKKDGTSLQRYALERFETLDEKQITAVAKFLEYVTQHAPADGGLSDDAQMALARYWRLPAKERPNNSLHTDARENSHARR